MSREEGLMKKNDQISILRMSECSAACISLGWICEAGRSMGYEAGFFFIRAAAH